MQEAVPQTIGRYRVEKRLGMGAMGVVYLAHDEMIDRKVAVKSIRFEKLANEEERRQSVDLFFKEAKIVGKLNHPHIAAIFDMGIEGDCPFLVMEYVTGKTIKRLIDRKVSISLENVLKLISMIARAMHYAHQRGILHRDIKPANIMIIPNLTPKIMDFGIARLGGPSTAESSKQMDDEEGLIFGTPHYMSPEQIRGSEMDQRSDVFSLGVLTYEWIAGEKAFKGTNLREIITGIVRSEPNPLSEISRADKELEAVIDKALEKDPEERFKNAEEFSDALEIYLINLEKKKEEEDSAVSSSFSFSQLKIIDQLRKNYVFFSDFTEEELFNIFRLSVRERFGKGDVIIQEGTSGVNMYVILRGAVSIIKDMNGKSVEVKKMSGGECFGEMAIIDKMPRSASVVALEQTDVIAINEAVLRQSNPRLCFKLYRSLAAMVSDKLRALDKKYLDLLSSREDKSDAAL